ncbi:MAG TPA: bifunctional phosphoribosylaminoimidazolecarboxamide formyltransferase/IMP cyclohydrolase [Fibrobacteria bacterium]|nr:bifunctional phosphoribosylaminoimidazolecarboxamide formyltransferase/IMP cyclohydrolase [Fibrobacteria bacterium]HOX52313.1 bifunctional phosphoribosylaminoimidazolecarboxamide formyltransferase/IMP cyclohydrolase [Fibrobacteria bacterium]
MSRIALLSVSDKTGLVEFAKGLSSLGWKLVSTGGTLKALKDAGLAATAIDELTGHPEILEGRVKTLHPKVHGGLLGRPQLADHKAQMDQNGISPIDLVVVNLYPFEATVARGAGLEEAIENIDIGGPSMLRSAAKNHERVTVVCDPADYAAVLAELQTGDTTPATRQKLAIKVYATTSRYDSAIERHLAKTVLGEERLDLRFGAGQVLRYGENNHQKAKFFLESPAVQGGEPSLGNFVQHHGKELSYNNIVDADAALEAARELSDACGAVVIKHLNPCGFSTGASLKDALVAAWAGDPVSAFGSVIALTRKVDLATAEVLKGRFVEILLAPGFEPDALEFLKAKSKDIRILEIADFGKAKDRKVYKHVIGGMLEQDRDAALLEKFESATKVAFPGSKRALAEFTWKACKHLKSNSIAIGCEYAPGQYTLVGAGMGQPNRIDSNQKLAQPRVKDWLSREMPGADPAKAIEGMVLCSDAFFPFPDNVEAAHQFGLKLIVQPGGSVRDADSVAKCDELGMAMAFTGMRHFRH